jgi:hypothetical protein
MGDHRHTTSTSTTLRRLARRPLVATLVVLILLLVDQVRGDDPSSPETAERAPSGGERPPAVVAVADIAKIEDPITLQAAGRHWLAHGDRELARKCFAAAVKRHEANLYTELAGRPWGDALVREMMGEADEAEELWKRSMDSDVLAATHTLLHFSTHPKRTTIIAAAKAHVLAIAAKAKAGGKAVFYRSAKGEPREIEPMTAEDFEAAVLAGEKPRNVYVEVLDLSRKKWPTRVSCQRCMVGKLLAWDADFEDQLDFKGFVLEDLHLGKKWKGEVNKSAFEPASRFNRLYLESTVVFGKADFDSMKLSGRVANFPFAVFLGETNLRNVDFGGAAEFRFAHFARPVSFRGSHFADSAYFAHGHFAGLDLSRTRVDQRPVHFASATFTGDLLVEDAQFAQGVTFENARFDGDVTFRRCSIDSQLNLSRIVTAGRFLFSRNEVKDLWMYGGEVMGDATFDNNVVQGGARFALDELTRRDHLDDVTPLHKLYKLYQGDDDAEEDLTKKSQYGVTHVDDLLSRFHGDVSFANTAFKEYVGFERVSFGSVRTSLANFYNTQFGGEAHFERARFFGTADFRTVGGEELSFNQARFESHWLLDDANVPGRLSTNETELAGDATLSIAGADVAAFGIDNRQLLRDVDQPWDQDGHRLFYQRCVLALARGRDAAAFLLDPRLADAHWDGDRRLEDEAVVKRRAQELCVGRTIDEFTRLRDAFARRSMTDEADWAYWHLKHHINHRRASESTPGMIIAFGERWVFEKAFGWGVLLANLLATSLVVILVFAVVLRLTCGHMELVWDGEPTLYRDLSAFALLVISMHGFLGGFGVADEFVKNSSSAFKALYTAEIVVGIIVITFFIGAYTRLVVG